MIDRGSYVFARRPWRGYRRVVGYCRQLRCASGEKYFSPALCLAEKFALAGQLAASVRRPRLRAVMRVKKAYVCRVTWRATGGMLSS